VFARSNGADFEVANVHRDDLKRLKPVKFHYKTDTKGTPQFGLVAEEVANVNPDLVVRDKNGDIYSVRYDAVNAMLLNEFLKEHRAFLQEQRKVEEQEKTIVELKSGMTALAATVKEQTAQIQKVSAQLRRATLRRKWSTIPKTAPAPIKQQHFQRSAVTLYPAETASIQIVLGSTARMNRGDGLVGSPSRQSIELFH
jgi:hypothetical protein